MAYGRMTAQYRKTEVETAGRIDLVIMCYDKAIQQLRQARVCYAAKAFEEKGKALECAVNILYELRAALDLERGGEVARNLDALYAYLTKNLLRADLDRDLESFDEGIRLLSTLKDAWEQIARGDDRASAPTPAGQRMAQHDRARAAA